MCGVLDKDCLYKLGPVGNLLIATGFSGSYVVERSHLLILSIVLTNIG